MIFFFFSRSGDHRDLHSFPTRRSSDLTVREVGSKEGLFVGPEGAACFAALKSLRRTGKIDIGERIVIFNTGSDRKSTRLNSSHTVISYAVFCLKKKIKDSIYS